MSVANPSPTSRPFRLVIITGQEGAGKSTLVRALLPDTPCGAQIDAEDVGQVNPWIMDEAFRDLLRRNVAGLVRNFWRAGYVNVIAGSFISNYTDYLKFRQLLSEPAEVAVVQLLASKQARDHRRIARSKPTSKQWRDRVDAADPEDTTLREAPGDYRHIAIDSSQLTVAETALLIKRALPDVFDSQPTSPDPAPAVQSQPDQREGAA